MTYKSANYEINSAEDLRKQIRESRLRIISKEYELRERVKQVPGELFYSGVDSLIPSILSGRVSSFALNAGKGLINNFFVRKAVTAGSFKLLQLVKPSGIVRRIQTGFKAIARKKK